MSTYGQPTHHWRREEIEPGLWLSLGLSCDGGVTEVTARQFFSFKMLNGYANGDPRWFYLTKPIMFDKIVVAHKRAGEVADVLHNGMQAAGPNFPVIVTPHWKDMP